MQRFSGWNEQRVKELKQEGKIRDFQFPDAGSKKHKRNKNQQLIAQKNSVQKDWLHLNIAYWCNEHLVTMETEYKFHPDRKWRFDWAIPALMLALEYEGIFADKSRHTTVSGYTGDVEKYNAAQQLGWRIIRITAKDYKTVLQQLNAYL